MTEMQKLICDTYLECGKMSAVARKLNTSITYVSGVLDKFNLRKASKRRKILPEVEQQIYKDYLERNSTEIEIAKKYDITVNDVRKIWKQNGNGKVREKLIKCDDHYFNEINSPQKAWLLGFIAGDGSIATKYILSILLSRKDRPFLEKIVKFLNSEHQIFDEIRKINDKTYHQCRFNICRKEIYYDLIKWGITPQKSNVLSIPKIDESLISHFIRGIVCSDGSFSIDDFNEINFCIASPIFSFLEEIQDHLIKNCKLTKTKISSNKNKTCYNLRYGGNLQVRKIFEYLYPDDTGDAYLERKYNYCKQHFYNLDNNTKSRNRGEPTLNQYSFTTDLRHLQILKSSEILQSHTYNLNPNPNQEPN